MLTVAVKGDPANEVISKLLAKLDDLTPAMAGIGQELESRVSARFETETGLLGQLDPTALNGVPKSRT